MALITCPECGREVSDRATSCPACAFPLGAASLPVPAQVQTIEATGKTYKMLQLGGGVLLIVGLIAFVSAEDKSLAGIVLFASIVCYVWGRVGAWWHHG